MDMDEQIIEAVRKQHCLYAYNFNIEERKRGWKELSEKLQINDLHLKIRWHQLVQRYQNDTNFKYAQQMDFVQLKEKDKAQTGNWPEFEITEQDVLETERTGDQYVFLDVEDLEENSGKEFKDDTPKHEGDDNNQLSNELLSSLMDSVTNDSEKCDKNANNANTILVSTVGNNQNKENLDDVPLENMNNTVTVTEHKSAAANETLKTTHDRSEDDIFGELVAAMLKHMDTDKKRMVKKEIMNLLLT